MGNLLFSPNGRIGPSEMIRGGVTLIVIGAVLGLLPILIGQGLAGILGLVGFLLLIPWIFLWMKRYRDAGQSPWMCLIPIAVYIVLGMIASMFVVGGGVFSAAMEAAQSGGTQAETEAAIEAAMGSMKSIAIKSTLVNVVVGLLVLFGFNSIIKHNPNA